MILAVNVHLHRVAFLVSTHSDGIFRFATAHVVSILVLLIISSIKAPVSVSAMLKPPGRTARVSNNFMKINVDVFAVMREVAKGTIHGITQFVTAVVN